mmetsp:Transcript_13900/g.44065  ORF Transcript_13900/g.44065 Transcript_13900/m.44065 type:complete len:107 (-) Transcript_13900:2387-2707(-)|eukprot:CAMPEP_0182913484 /NCGR_PEP_ID=MMETSP0034_2-20130328/38068_1 /TAXON_ID=156128 /ORGANISM="Nephroselmis pyriformis, Strain CCMP717" /LENGTH=106 /DNA_ID=CAMNT_0025050211 /DNA_START=139 /DNA_END=459 /DNA_ORIENTATION=-
MVSLDKPAKPTVPLTGRQVLAYKLGIYFFLAVFIVAATGLAVIIDQDNKLLISRSEFGRLWRMLIDWNPFISALGFNFPLIMILVCWRKLYDNNELKAEMSKKKKT